MALSCLRNPGRSIEFNKDDKLQDWLERSYFGKLSESERYGGLDQQMEELQVALKG